MFSSSSPLEHLWGWGRRSTLRAEAEAWGRVALLFSRKVACVRSHRIKALFFVIAVDCFFYNPKVKHICLRWLDGAKGLIRWYIFLCPGSAYIYVLIRTGTDKFWRKNCPGFCSCFFLYLFVLQYHYQYRHRLKIQLISTPSGLPKPVLSQVRGP